MMDGLPPEWTIGFGENPYWVFVLDKDGEKAAAFRDVSICTSFIEWLNNQDSGHLIDPI